MNQTRVSDVHFMFARTSSALSTHTNESNNNNGWSLPSWLNVSEVNSGFDFVLWYRVPKVGGTDFAQRIRYLKRKHHGVVWDVGVSATERVFGEVFASYHMTNLRARRFLSLVKLRRKCIRYYTVLHD